MSNVWTTVVFRPEASATQAFVQLRLEQETWPSEHPGGLTGWLAEQGRQPSVWNLFDLYAEYQAGCNGKGRIETTIHVLKSRPGLPYSLATSAGELSGPKRLWFDITKTVAVDLEQDIDLAREGFETVAHVSWAGPVFDAAGRRVPPPALAVSGARITVAVKVIGTLTVAGRGRRDDWTLTMPAGGRAEVMAVYSGKVERLTVEPPPVSGCSGGVAFTVDGSGGGRDECVKRVIEVDACSGEVLSDTVEPAPCDEGG